MNAEDDPKKKKDSAGKRRRRLPILAMLRLDDELPSNLNHPLAGAPPEKRAASRLRLIAAILARLARRANGSA